MSESGVHEWRGLRFKENGNGEWQSPGGVTVAPNGMYRFEWDGIAGYGATAEEARATCDGACVRRALKLLQGMPLEGDSTAAIAIAAARAQAERWEQRVLVLEARLRVVRDAAEGRI